MIFDTHAHCYWDTLEPRIDEVVANMQKNWVTQAVQIGCDIESSEKAIVLAQRFPWIFYATVGLHPETAQDTAFVVTAKKQNSDCEDSETCRPHDIYFGMKELIQKNRDVVVAVGECGFDFHYLSQDPEVANLQKIFQEIWFSEQWELAQRYDLPLVIHTRDARDATLEFMKSNGIKRCVMHCFSEDWDFARALLDFSDEIYFSFSGILTYKKSEKIQEAAKNIPMNRILVETDAPFLAPQTVRGKVNEPAYTRYTLEKLAELRWVQVEEIEDIIYQNSLRFYWL